MKKLPTFILASAGLFLSGCAATTASRSRNSTSTPAGPVTTSAAAPSMIGAGTNLVVRTTEAISTARDTPGKTYSAEVTNDIVDQGGNMLVPKGSPVQLTAVASPGGTSDATEVQLAILSMTVNGKTYQVTSATAEGGASLERPEQSARAPGLTLADLAAQALADAVDRLEKKKGEPFPPRKGELKGGRPMK